tara:strand:- start:45 stop:458 length:414 start_codon:yes stop_codon:yes gene_type:complete
MVKKKKIFFIIFLSSLFSSLSYAGWFDKKIKVSKCYDTSAFSSYKQLKKENRNHLWEWEINPEEKTAILSFHSGKKLYIRKHEIIMQTDKYIVVTDNKTPDTKFDLKRERVITEHSKEMAKILSLKDPTTTLQCDFD